MLYVKKFNHQNSLQPLFYAFLNAGNVYSIFQEVMWCWKWVRTPFIFLYIFLLIISFDYMGFVKKLLKCEMNGKQVAVPSLFVLSIHTHSTLFSSQLHSWALKNENRALLILRWWWWWIWKLSSDSLQWEQKPP